MIKSIISKVQSFRQRLFRLFQFRSGATMDLIDAIAASAPDSVVKISLSFLFRRTYCSITDVADNLFRHKAEQNLDQQELKTAHLKITQLLAEECSASGQRGFVLLATDCTARPRIYAKTVEDRSFVHAPNHVPGQKPITVGHEYSLVVFLPEDKRDRSLHWTLPLSLERVQTSEIGSQIGFEQVKTIVTQTVLQAQLCVCVADCAYSTSYWTIGVDAIPNLIEISRLRKNRILYHRPLAIEGKRSRGRPSIYGLPFRLKDPPEPDQEEEVHQLSPGKDWTIRLSRWNNLLTRGCRDDHMENHPFGVIRAQVFNSMGQLVFKKPLWLEVVGERRDELTSWQVYDCYTQRYDIEHCFRFGKQKLLLAGSQTSNTRHEENLTWLALLSLSMLYQVRHLANEIRYRWEKHRVVVLGEPRSASQVQRDYARIIREIGTPARIPKPRGKSPGRQKGTIVPRRMEQPVIRKTRRVVARC